MALLRSFAFAFRPSVPRLSRLYTTPSSPPRVWPVPCQLEISFEETLSLSREDHEVLNQAAVDPSQENLDAVKWLARRHSEHADAYGPRALKQASVSVQAEAPLVGGTKRIKLQMPPSHYGTDSALPLPNEQLEVVRYAIMRMRNEVDMEVGGLPYYNSLAAAFEALDKAFQELHPDEDWMTD